MCFVVTTYPFISCSFMGHGSKFQGTPCPPAPITVLPPVCHILGPRTEHVQAFQPLLWKLMTTVIPYDFPVILLVFTATWRLPTMGVLRLVALGSVPSKFQSLTKLSQAVKMTNEMMFPILNRYMPTAGKLIARPTRRPFSDHSATVAARDPFGCRWPRHVCVCADGEPDQSAFSEHQSPVTQLFQMQRTWQELKSWTNDHENSQNCMDPKILLSSCWFLQVASLEIHSQLSAFWSSL